jgi:hypothetical protein
MSLQTVVEARVATTRLVSLTNPGVTAPTTVDTTKLGHACADAAAEFEVHTGVAFDETDARHISPAIDLVILTLQERGSAPVENLGAQREKIITRLESLAKVTGRNRIMPEAASETSETFGDSAFDSVLLDPQGAEDADIQETEELP